MYLQKNMRLIVVMSVLFLLGLCGCEQSQSAGQLEGKQEVAILQSWQGNYPVSKINLLPEGQRGVRTGYITDAQVFAAVWGAFDPSVDLPMVNFDTNMVVFVRNIRYYNLIRIGKAELENGTLELLAMETMSAMPIEDKAAISMAVVPKAGITHIKNGDILIPVE